MVFCHLSVRISKLIKLLTKKKEQHAPSNIEELAPVWLVPVSLNNYSYVYSSNFLFFLKGDNSAFLESNSEYVTGMGEIHLSK